MADSKLADLTAAGALDGDELLYVVDDPAGTPADRKVTVDTVRGANVTPDATVDNVTAAVLVSGQGQDVNGYVFKANAAAETGYGKGQAFMVLEEGTGDATDQTATGSVLFRVDRHGNLGTTGAMHVATGLRNDDGQGQALWIDPSDNMHCLVIHNPSVAEAATWDQDFISIVDVRNANAVVFRVDSLGDVYSSRTVVVRDGTSTRVSIGDVYGFPGVAFGAAADTIVYRLDTSIVGVGNVLHFPETTAPAGAADAARIFARDSGAGKTQLCVQFGTGTPIVLATEP